MKININKVSLITILISLLLTTTVFAAPGIKDYAGTGEPGFMDGKLVESKFNQPWGLAMGPNGSLIIVDSANHKIRKVVDNKITTLAGMTEDTDAFGLPLGGHADDDALKAFFNQPRYAVVDAKGDLYISDSKNNVIRKLTGGKVFTYAGTGQAGYADGDRTKAQFNSPSGLAIDKANNLYVADTLNHVIRKIDPNGNVTTFAGQYVKDHGGFLDDTLKKARFTEPNDLVFDDKGNLYVSDSGNHLIRLISGDKVTTYAGKPTTRNQETGYMEGGYRNGEKANALFNFPKGLAYSDGVLFVADSLNHRVRAIKSDGAVINLVGQSAAGDEVGTTADAKLFSPMDVVYYKGKLYISDLYSNKVKVMEISLNNLQGVKNVEDIMASIELHPVGEDIQVWFNDQQMQLSKEKPIINESGIYLPIRSVFEGWGATVGWIGSTKEVELKKGEWQIRFGIDQPQIISKDGRTYIEVDHLARITKFLVEWVEEYRAVIIASDH